MTYVLSNMVNKFGVREQGYSPGYSIVTETDAVEIGVPCFPASPLSVRIIMLRTGLTALLLALFGQSQASLMISPTILKLQRMVSPTVLNTSQGTHDIPHGTQDNPHGTHDIPPRYSRYPQGTEHQPRSCIHVIQSDCKFSSKLSVSINVDRRSHLVLLSKIEFAPICSTSKIFLGSGKFLNSPCFSV